MSLIEAQDPKTPAARLVELAKIEDAEILAALAKNPSTPLGVLLALVARFPAEFLENPVLSMLLLEDPTFLRGASAESYQVLFAAGRPPAWLVRSLLSEPKELTRNQVAGSPQTPLVVLVALSQDPQANVRRNVAKNPSASSLLDALSQDRDRLVRRSVAENASASPSLLASLAHDQDLLLRCRVAAHAMTPPEILAALAKDHDLEVRCQVAKNRHAPLAVVEALMRDPEEDVRELAARYAARHRTKQGG